MSEKVFYLLENRGRIEMQCNVHMLLNALTEVELMQLRDALKYEYDSDMRKAVEFRLREKPVKPINKPISTLIKLFENKKSRCVVASRNELQRRYDFQSRQVQRNILNCFLSSNVKSDRVWAYNCLHSDWDKYFQTKILLPWKKYHDVECGWVILKYQPSEVLMNMRDEFQDIHYKHLCIRLAHCEGFEIDRTRLDYVDYLYVAAKAGLNVNEAEVCDYLVKYITEYFAVIDDYTLSNPISMRHKYKYTISVANYGIISRYLWCMSKLGMLRQLVCFYDWDRTIIGKYMSELNKKEKDESADIFREILAEDPSPFEYCDFSNNAECLVEFAENEKSFDFNSFDIGESIVDKTQVFNEIKEQYPEISTFIEEWDVKDIDSKSSDASILEDPF